jgi:Rad52/22 family double-strand break repair protein
MSNEIIKIDAQELSLVESNALTANQLKLLFKRTPTKFIKTRPAKGGGVWDYVSGGYIRKVLNLMFGWDWDFEVMSEQIIGNQVLVKGRLTCRVGSRSIVKMQFGGKEIMYRKGTQDPLNIANDFKAATTDCLKKCAAELGIASDVYSKEEFKELNVVSTSYDAVNDFKEQQRVLDYIKSCTTIGMLETVKSTCDTLGLQKEYQAKEAQING